MNELKFKTTLKCNGCKDKIAPDMNAIEEIEKWEIDFDSADKILTVFSPKNIESKITEIVEKAGFKLEKIN